MEVLLFAVTWYIVKDSPAFAVTWYAPIAVPIFAMAYYFLSKAENPILVSKILDTNRFMVTFLSYPLKLIYSLSKPFYF